MWICTMKNDISLRITLDSCVHLIIEEKKTINQIVGQITNIQLALKQLSGGNPTWARCCRVVTVPIMFFIMHIIGKEAYVIAVNVLSAKERGGEGEDCCEC
ncbi:hypothetical protein NC653_021602 [Populus alba x Populus x berolinensis]|uniref:Uncharacterized protein n=1 Tax=Populus alba x Populus x berolinensis TaxID=444605 RepID=A0AAD6MNX6_9ROSI|nr:hypothetical protein NC653_021602 [Populus alba x Populus x berolinensis]